MDYQKLYTHLFNVVTDVLVAMENCNYGTAMTILKGGQRWTESAYIDGETEEERKACFFLFGLLFRLDSGILFM